MGKPILERMARPSWWGDQALHAAGGALACAAVADPLAYAAGWNVALCAALGALAAGLLAIGWEFAQNWGDAPETGGQLDSVADVGGFWLGMALGLLTLFGV